MPAEILNKEKILDHAKRLIEEGRLEKAIQEYRKILAADPKDMRVNLRIAELYAKLKRVQDAIKVYQEVADSYVEDGFYLKAVTVYKNILRLNPSLVEINKRLAGLYEKMGLGNDAIVQYQIVASTLEQKGDYAGALDVRKRMVALDPNDASGRVRLAESYQCLGMEEEALDEYERLVGVMEKQGESNELIELYEKVLMHRADNIEMVRKICRVYHKKSEFKKALKWLEQNTELIRQDAELLNMSAEIYKRLNQLETAKGKYRDLAEFYERQGDVDNALLAWEKILIMNPDFEEEVRESVEILRDGAFDSMKQRVDAQRQKMVEEEQHRQEVEDARLEVAEEISQVEGVDVERDVLKPDEIDGAIKKAQASFDLGKAYRIMGLLVEAKDEFNRSLQLYRRLFVSNPNIEGIMNKVKELEGMVKSQDAAAAVSSAKVAKPVKTQPETGSTGEETPKQRSEKKKAAAKEEPPPEITKNASHTCRIRWIFSIIII
jgi:tetratricopeptide (TPR) repeat protein